MPWKPSEPGEVPTLGWLAIDWMVENLAMPDCPVYTPFTPYLEQQDFLLRLYELDPVTGKRIRRRAVYSRPRGAGKSPFMAAISLLEALGPVVPNGWNAGGQPVGVPWSSLRTPWVQIAAISETQTRNTWVPLLEMCEGPVYENHPGIEPMGTFVNLPGTGRIEPVTSSARTIKGSRPILSIMDQTEEWVPSNGGVKMAETMRINAAKVGGITVESPNAYTPGEDSVAEGSATYWRQILTGSARDKGLYYDHREAPADTNLADRESLMAGLRVAYGDSSGHPDGCVIHEPSCAPGHVDLDVVLATVWDPAIHPQVARGDFLNQITHAPDAYVSQYEWAGCEDDGKSLATGDVVVLGFDGSRGRARGKPDSTALVAVRVLDGHAVPLGIWEAPDGPAGDGWSPPIAEIEAAIRTAYNMYRVVAFYADPAKDWRSHVNSWEATYGSKTKIKVSKDHPFEWWMTGGRSGLIQRAVEQLESAVRLREMTHDGSYHLTRHMLSARRRVRHGKLSIAKEHDYSDRKIDAAVALVLAWQARLDAVAQGLGQRVKTVTRIR